MSKKITIISEGGLIQDIIGVPKGFEIEELDKDILKEWDEDDVPRRNHLIKRLKELGKE